MKITQRVITGTEPRLSPRDQLLLRPDMPNFSQRNRFLPFRGDKYCGPVSVANEIAWLAKHDLRFQPLFPTERKPEELILELGEKMKTSYRGTRDEGLLDGLKQFTGKRRFDIYPELFEMGYTQVLHDFGNDIMQTILEAGGNIDLGITYYSNDPIDRFDMQKRHYVSVRGFDEKARHFLINDPDSYERKSIPVKLHSSITPDGYMALEYDAYSESPLAYVDFAMGYYVYS